MITTFLLFLLYLAVALAVVAGVRWLKRRIELPFLLFFWLLPIVFLFPCFFASQTPLPVDHAMLLPPWSTLSSVTRHNANLNDAATQMAPWAKAVRMAWKEGSLPLRDRWNGCGTALAANGQSAAFSPFTFLMMPLPLARAFSLAVAVKLFLALCGTWLWLVELKVSRGGALFGAMSFAFSFTMTPWLLFPHTAVICLWPWALFTIELLRDHAVRRRGFWTLTVIFFLWPLCGHPESVALGAGFAAAFLLARSLCRDLPEPVAVFRQIALAAAVAVGLSAFLLLPQIFAIAGSNRLRVAAEFSSRLPLHWAPHGPNWGNGFFTAFFPRSLGDGIRSPMIQGAAGSFSEMSLAYFGIAGWAVALLILRPGSARRQTEWALLVPLLVGFSLAVALWPIFEIFLHLPVIRMMVPLRYFSWVALAGAAISAFELDRLRADLSKGRQSVLAFLLVLFALAAFAVVTFACFRNLHAVSGGLPSQQNALALVLLALGGTAVVATFSASKPLTHSALPLLLTVIAGAELLYQGRRLYRFGSPGELFPETPLIAFLRAQPAPFRVLGEGAVLFPNSNVFAGLEDIRTHDPVERRDYVEFLDVTAGYSSAEYFKNIQNVNAPAFDFLNVKYLVSTPGRAAPGEKWKQVYAASDGTVFENTLVLPRVFEPRDLRVITKVRHGLRPENVTLAYGRPFRELFTSLDWRREAIVLADGVGNFYPNARAIPSNRVHLTAYEERINSASFRAQVQPGNGDAIVIASLVQDGGWSAHGAGRRVLPTGRANGPFLAISLPPGEYLVRLSYSPPGFFLGTGISLATLCVLAALGAWVRTRSHPPRSRDFRSG